MNPNNNQNFNDEALKINRALKKRIDKANAIVDNLLGEHEEAYMSNEQLQYLQKLKEILS
jgi:hypothetical protein|tara:strand:+ start:55 stop:234 length:180 start_codon:yes stop_codon:yes gene_type:complete